MTGKDYAALMKKSPHNARKALFDEYCNYVYTIVFNKLRSYPHEDTEECVSDIFAEIYLALDSEKAYSGNLKGYIGTIAKRTAIDRYRSLSARESHTVYVEDEKLSEIKAEDDIITDTENADMRNILLTKIEELGEPDSTIIIQKFYYNRNSQEIAKILSMKSSAVRMRCTRAMKRLKEKLIESGITI